MSSRKNMRLSGLVRGVEQGDSAGAGSGRDALGLPVLTARPHADNLRCKRSSALVVKL